MYVIQFGRQVHLVVEVWKKERKGYEQTAVLVESCDMLKKGSWCVPLSKP